MSKRNRQKYMVAYNKQYYRKNRSVLLPRKTNQRKRRRLAQKRRAVQLLGGKCQLCGYNKCIYALEFHHKNPNENYPKIGNIWGMKWERIFTELKKCILICSNCHKEKHFGNDSVDKW